MNRTISVSTGVFASIWASRKEGEETEDDILRRVLDVSSDTADSSSPQSADTTPVGVWDGRNNLQFPRGFVAFRNYKGKSYEAVAQDGNWLRTDTGVIYESLNRVNQSIVDGNENIWNGNWKYRTADGAIKSINQLRR